ncbi:MAG: PhzF family phenazine biosynthesis protein [Candidatus Aminicenantes bacterium]|nr:PhzF family phenazine biosynthesis protein [Candidatus Aminicenantes bacterium]
MKIRMYQVDAFTDKIFGGNAAAVCPLEAWLPDAVMQAIAEENNLSETAFFVRAGDRFDIRWFTPKIEIALAGHPTLATAHVIFRHLGYDKPEIVFQSKSGELRAARSGDVIQLDFPGYEAKPVKAPKALVKGLRAKPVEVLLGRDYTAVFEKEADILALDPDFAELAKLDCLGIIVTAPGDRSDFVSRFFAPRAGILEDPVTGSAHTLLIPYWAKRLGKPVLHAYQVSKRRGEIFCEQRGDRVLIGGRAVTFFEGEIEV